MKKLIFFMLSMLVLLTFTTTAKAKASAEKEEISFVDHLEDGYLSSVEIQDFDVGQSPQTSIKLTSQKFCYIEKLRPSVEDGKVTWVNPLVHRRARDGLKWRVS